MYAFDQISKLKILSIWYNPNFEYFLAKLATFFPEYLPTLEYIWYFVQADYVILTDHFQFAKRSLVTRSAKLNLNDPILSIPVQHQKNMLRIGDVVSISDTHWRKKHFNTIYHQFHNAPFAYYYMPILKDLIHSDVQNLSDYVYNILLRLIDWLHFDTIIKQAVKIGYQSENFDSILEWCRLTSSDTYLFTQQVFDNKWLNANDFKGSAIQLEPFSVLPEVHILDSNHHLSVLSFLFQYGPEAGYIIRQYQNRK